MSNRLIDKLNAMLPLINAVQDARIEAEAKFLYQRVKAPESYIVFLGETSSGKSSIINGLIGKNDLPVKVTPTTGIITEVEMISEGDEDIYSTLTRDAKGAIITKEIFDKLTVHPSTDLMRLKVKHVCRDKRLIGMRVFDTPGYGSILEHHDEVLKDFLPNSDVVIYTVDYRARIQKDEFAFISEVKELLRDKVSVILLINRCPEECTMEDQNVKSIIGYASDLFQIQPKVFLVPRMMPENGQSPVVSYPELWNYISDFVNAPERKKELEDILDCYIMELYHKLDAAVQTRYASAQMEKQDFIKQRSKSIRHAENIEKAIDTLIKPTFEKIRNALPMKFHQAALNAKANMDSWIDSQSKLDKREVTGYVTSHKLPFIIKEQNAEVQNYLDVEFVALNKKLEDLIQKEYAEFQNSLTIAFQSMEAYQNIAQEIVGKIMKKFMTNGLDSYFIAFGGNGGVKAGIANAASHTLKKIGEVFGKHFSKETHNQLKHFISKIGANSAKAVGAAVTIILEVAFKIVSIVTWKPLLKLTICNGIEKWEKDVVNDTIKDLKKLEERNIENIHEAAKIFASTFDEVQPVDIKVCLENVQLSEEIYNKIKK